MLERPFMLHGVVSQQTMPRGQLEDQARVILKGHAKNIVPFDDNPISNHHNLKGRREVATEKGNRPEERSSFPDSQQRSTSHLC
jgi:hypothetical protein